MNGFVSTFNVKSGEKVYICTFCPEEKVEEAKKIFVENFKEADFTGTKDDYYIDMFLLKIIKLCTPSYIKALGVGIIKKDAYNIGGGIIGSPWEDGESAEGKAECIGEGLYCCAFPGRFGVVYRADNSEEIYNNIFELNKKDIRDAVIGARDYLKTVSDEFIILSDGSGEGAFPYCAVYSNNSVEEFME